MGGVQRQGKQLQDMTEKVIEILEYSLDMFSNRNQEHMQEILNLEDEIDDREKKLQRAHVKRLTKNKCTPEVEWYFQIPSPDWSVWRTMPPTSRLLSWSLTRAWKMRTRHNFCLYKTRLLCYTN